MVSCLKRAEDRRPLLVLSRVLLLSAPATTREHRRKFPRALCLRCLFGARLGYVAWYLAGNKTTHLPLFELQSNGFTH